MKKIRPLLPNALPPEDLYSIGRIGADDYRNLSYNDAKTTIFDRPEFRNYPKASLSKQTEVDSKIEEILNLMSVSYKECEEYAINPKQYRLEDFVIMQDTKAQDIESLIATVEKILD